MQAHHLWHDDAASLAMGQQSYPLLQVSEGYFVWLEFEIGNVRFYIRAVVKLEKSPSALCVKVWYVHRATMAAEAYKYSCIHSITL